MRRRTSGTGSFQTQCAALPATGRWHTDSGKDKMGRGRGMTTLNSSEHVTPQYTLQLEGRVWWVCTLSRRKGIAGLSWARDPCMHTARRWTVCHLAQAMWESLIVPLLQIWKRCHEVSCPAQPLQWLVSCLGKSSSCCPNDVSGIVLVSSPPPSTGGCPEKSPAPGLGGVSNELSPSWGQATAYVW